MLGNYLNFSESFGKLSPYELNHLSEVLLCKIESLAEGKLYLKAGGKPLTEHDLKFALTEAMRDVLLQLRKQEINQQQINLAQTMSQIFVNETIAA
jgi:CTP:molybdopterin cytidylyltransferase MocA